MDMGTDLSTSDTEDEEVPTPSSNSLRKPVREDEYLMEDEDETPVSDSNSSQEEESARPRIKFRWKSVKTGSNVSLKVVEPNIELIPSPLFNSSVDVDRMRSLSSPVTCSCVWTQDTEEMCGQHCTNRKERRECSVETCREECNNMVSTTTNQ